MKQLTSRCIASTVFILMSLNAHSATSISCERLFTAHTMQTHAAFENQSQEGLNELKDQMDLYQYRYSLFSNLEQRTESRPSFEERYEDLFLDIPFSTETNYRLTVDLALLHDFSTKLKGVSGVKELQTLVELAVVHLTVPLRLDTIPDSLIDTYRVARRSRYQESSNEPLENFTRHSGIDLFGASKALLNKAIADIDSIENQYRFTERFGDPTSLAENRRKFEIELSQAFLRAHFAWAIHAVTAQMNETIFAPSDLPTGMFIQSENNDTIMGLRAAAIHRDRLKRLKKNQNHLESNNLFYQFMRPQSILTSPSLIEEDIQTDNKEMRRQLDILGAFIEQFERTLNTYTHSEM